MTPDQLLRIVAGHPSAAAVPDPPDWREATIDPAEYLRLIVRPPLPGTDPQAAADLLRNVGATVPAQTPDQLLRRLIAGR